MLNIDLAPTLLALAGVPVPGNMQGRSLVPLLRGKKNEWRRSFLIEYYSDRVFPRIVKMGYKAVRTERWKYIRYLELDGMDELYDLKADPYEMNNVISQPRAEQTLKAMRKELGQLLKQTSVEVSTEARRSPGNPDYSSRRTDSTDFGSPSPQRARGVSGRRRQAPEGVSRECFELLIQSRVSEVESAEKSSPSPSAPYPTMGRGEPMRATEWLRRQHERHYEQPQPLPLRY